MRELLPLAIPGAYEIRTEPKGDQRGFFARTLDFDVLRDAGLCDRFEQESISWNAAAGTLRGLHFQAAPAWETKIVTCTSGRVFDVVLDLRRDSHTFGRWDARELTASLCNSLYVPTGCAHGFQTVEPASCVLYRITPAYAPELARGVNPFDPEVAVRWPLSDPIVSQRDRSLPNLRDAL